jgi:hypothetical protein
MTCCLHPRRTSDFALRPSAFGLRASGFGLLALALALQPSSLLACAACYGQSDAPMAQGMNWGIMTLLGVIVAVLGTIAAFFVYLARRSSTLATRPAQPTPGRASVSASPDPARFPGRLGLAGTLALPKNTNAVLESSQPFL